MGRPLRVLSIEDSEDDTWLLIHELKKGGFSPVHERVQTAESLRAALRDKPWDVVLCDGRLPDLDCLDALALLKEAQSAIPFIVVSEAISDEMAVAAMKRGACDCIAKEMRQRLVPVIERELRESAMRRARIQAERQYRQSEEMFSLLVESAPDALFVQTGGDLVYVNPAAVRLFGAGSAGELLGRPLLDLIAPDFRGIVQEKLRLLDETGRRMPPMVQKYLKLDGTPVYVEASAVRFTYEDREGSLTYLRDITKRMEAEEKLEQSRQKLRRTLGSTVQAMALTVETRDPYTAGHQRRVSDLARLIAQEMGIEPEGVDGVGMASMIHDIGKISVPAETLSRPVRLLEIEIDLIRCHPRVGFEILKDIEFPWAIGQIVLQHHERMDGSGYPQGLRGDELCLEARILAVADVVEAMASHRPYRPGLGLDAALAEMTIGRGRLYDENAVDACLNLFAAGYRMPAD